jgi:hypothetical protein
MGFDSDVALLGTGVAPLLAASRFLAEGQSVLIVNPDWDFFREDSELPLDPFWPLSQTLKPDRLSRSLRKKALAALRPDFPGAIELWPRDASGGDKDGYHDLLAPHVRTRSRLWVYPLREKLRSGWNSLRETVETMYLEASDAGLKPSVLDGPAPLRRFPGAAQRATPSEEYEGVLLPKMCDVDVKRYRNGLLEFVRERLGAERVVCAASQIEVTPDGIRFRAGGETRTARLRNGLIVFWTPRISSWILSCAKKSEVPLVVPRGIRHWEEWSLLSRDSLDLETVGSFEDMTVWAEVEGAPDGTPSNRMAVLKAGPIVPFDISGIAAAPSNNKWLSSESFGALGRLCHDFLKWDRFSVRAVRPRAVLEWAEGVSTVSSLRSRHGTTPFDIKLVRNCDGPLVDVVNAARESCGSLQKSGEVT